MIQTLSSQSLLQNTSALVARERQITMELVEHLREIDRRMLFAEHGFGSLFEFCVKHLGLSEGSAHRRISAMRLMREVPEARESIASGKLSLSSATTLQNVFRQEKKSGVKRAQSDKADIVRKLEGLSKRETEQKLSEISPQAIPQDRERVLSTQKVEIRFVVDREALDKIEELKAMLAHRMPGASTSELFLALVEKELARIKQEKMGKTEKPRKPEQPVSIHSAAERTEKLRSETFVESGSQRAPTKRYIPLPTRKQVWRRADGKCEYFHAGRRCSSRHALAYCSP